MLAWKVIEYFHERMEDDEHVDLELLQMLMKHVFSQMVKEKRTAAQAFGLKPIRGKHKREDNFERDIRAATLVVKKMRKNATLEDAITWEGAVTDTAVQMEISDRIVERAYNAYRAGIEHLLDKQLEQLVVEPLVEKV